MEREYLISQIETGVYYLKSLLEKLDIEISLEMTLKDIQDLLLKEQSKCIEPFLNNKPKTGENVCNIEFS